LPHFTIFLYEFGTLPTVLYVLLFIVLLSHSRW